MEFRELLITDGDGIREMSAVATAILRDYYDPIIGKEQNDYMLAKFQTPDAIRGQLAEGYRFFFAGAGDRTAGFLAFYPRGGSLYLSKLYLYREERGRGYGREMVDFALAQAREAGLDGVELNVNRFNPTVEVYERMGFRRIRSEKIDIGGGFYMDDYVYRLDA